MVSLYELLGVLLTSFVLNLIPFAGPSNLLIAANVALLVNADPWTVGLLVALGSASAKSLHYVVAFFARRFVSERRRNFLDEARRRVGRWAFIALYVAAATPIPDEPVVIPLGLLRYSPAKFYLAYFLGKLSITIPGAYAGGILKERFEPLIGQEAMTIASIVMTIVITIILLKVDVNRVVQNIKRRWRATLEGRHDHGGANAVMKRLRFHIGL
jgi:membrane protein YqaA with SNARE-associated domain